MSSHTQGIDGIVGFDVPAGYYPNGYRVGYDAQAKEYQIALTDLGWRN
jgi:hypothetical protein